MIETFKAVLEILLGPETEEKPFSIFDPSGQFHGLPDSKADTARCINSAFLIALTGRKHPMFEQAEGFLQSMAESPEWREPARFYVNGIEKIHQEIEAAAGKDTDLASSLTALHEWLSDTDNLKKTEEIVERVWSVFFPEATGVKTRRQELKKDLRNRRTVKIKTLNPNAMSDPARQLLFTSNVLLTIPSASHSLDALPLSNALKDALGPVMEEEQCYWFDHPIQIGVESEKNEVIYGLRGLEEALAFERHRGNASEDSRLTCVLSVSVTHNGLHAVAKEYLKEAFSQAGGLNSLDVYVFSESDTRRLIDEILAPAARHFLGANHSETLLKVFGVDGEYGRHYSFLKAIAAFWRVLVQPEKEAAFKIDLDQVFPQKELVEQTGGSAFDHFKTPLWGARGTDASGQPVDLGLIAGALVNESDINHSLFTPDVQYPDRPLSLDETIFFSQLPQALSTEAEIMARYDTECLDGKRTCLQRIHITGGTNGILVDSLFQYRPFTPSFMGRAEDQAYLLSVLMQPGQRLAYVHEDGLIMRHDKDAFAQEAIASAHVGKLIGDYVRILYFSAYARVLAEDVSAIKKILDPFTSCFISKIPITIVYLRFALRAASLFASGKDKEAVDFVTAGAKRLKSAMDFVRTEDGLLKLQFERERLGWNLYYDTLSALAKALSEDDRFANELQKRAEKLIDACAI